MTRRMNRSKEGTVKAVSSRNEIEQEAEVAIQLKNLEAEERARIAREESGKRRDSEEAEISSRREFEAERAVEQERLRKDREVQ